jgi:hypothetical protein
MQKKFLSVKILTYSYGNKILTYYRKHRLGHEMLLEIKHITIFNDIKRLNKRRHYILLLNR